MTINGVQDLGEYHWLYRSRFCIGRPTGQVLFGSRLPWWIWIYSLHNQGFSSCRNFFKFTTDWENTFNEACTGSELSFSIVNQPEFLAYNWTVQNGDFISISNENALISFQDSGQAEVCVEVLIVVVGQLHFVKT
ncbi:MAG: hypothetical protein R2784_03910 [Saprospiraceae bacterium]